MTNQLPNAALSVIHLYAREEPDDAATDHHGTDIEAAIERLNDVLAIGLVGVLRYRCHHFTARALHAQVAAMEFMIHANAQLRHADLLAERIVQLGGTPNFSPDELTLRSRAGYFSGESVAGMVRDDLTAAGKLIDSYRSMIEFCGERDATTRCLLEGFLAVEEDHADELSELLVSRFRASAWMLETHRLTSPNMEVAL